MLALLALDGFDGVHLGVALEGETPRQALVEHNSHCPVVDGGVVPLAPEHFGSAVIHISSSGPHIVDFGPHLTWTYL